MWIGGDTPIEVQRNATLDFSAQVIDQTTESPVNLSGYQIRCAVAAFAGGAVIAEPYCEVDSPADGGFYVRFVGSDFDAVEGSAEKVLLTYDIRLLKDSSVSTVMRGPLILLPGVGN